MAPVVSGQVRLDSLRRHCSLRVSLGATRLTAPPLLAQGIVLMRGEVSKPLTMADAQTVAHQVQLCYLVDSLYTMVEAFNHAPTTFDYRKVRPGRQRATLIGIRE